MMRTSLPGPADPAAGFTLLRALGAAALILLCFAAFLSAALTLTRNGARLLDRARAELARRNAEVREQLR